jgi:hypothetical protein
MATAVGADYYLTQPNQILLCLLAHASGVLLRRPVITFSILSPRRVLTEYWHDDSILT